MPEPVLQFPLLDDRLLLDELNHRIINEFASIISIVSHAAAHSANEEVEHALRAVAQLLHHHAEVHHGLQLPHREALVCFRDQVAR